MDRMSAKDKRRAKTKVPRAAYCTGCGNIFGKMHRLFEHRRRDHCGGIFLSPEEREKVDKLRLEREAMLRRMREDE